MNPPDHSTNLTEPTCDIFIRSYRKDFDWLRYCLAAIDRFCSGFREVVVVIPRSSRPWARRAGLAGWGARVETCPDVRDDYLGQQATKLLADRFSDADYLVHVDSDCVFQRPLGASELIRDGRPRVLYCPNGTLGRHRPWQQPTERFLGRPVRHDYMRHPPFTYPRWLYARIREHCRAAHGTDIESYVLHRPSRGFSEFNALGAFAHERHRSSFDWVEVAPGAVPGAACRWYWSWGGITPGIRSELDALVR